MEQAKAVTGGMPKSCRRVLEVLDSCDYASQKEIVSKAGLSARSVKAALKRLVTAKAVREFSIIDDLRRKTYSKGD